MHIPSPPTLSSHATAPTSLPPAGSTSHLFLPDSPTWTGTRPAVFSRGHAPLLQHREGPAPRWHGLLSPRCVPRDLTQFPHSSNPAPTLDLTTQPLPKDMPGRSPPKCQGHSRCQRSQLQFAGWPCAGNYRRTCYGQRKPCSCLCLQLRFCY